MSFSSSSESKIDARFADPAFREFHKNLKLKSESMISRLLAKTPCLIDFASVAKDLKEGEEHDFDSYKKEILMELKAFIECSFGHELNFIGFISVLYTLNFFGTDLENQDFNICPTTLGGLHRHRPTHLEHQGEMLFPITEMPGMESDHSNEEDEFDQSVLWPQGSETDSTTVTSSSEKNPDSRDQKTTDKIQPITLAEKQRAGALSSMALIIFHKYIRIIRLINNIYRLEPAGSKGAWGLDDYNFLPFLWGAFQAAPSSAVVPRDALNETLAADLSPYMLYFDAIHHARMSKSKAPFQVACPLLHDISQLPEWTRVGNGLLRMHAAEVLNNPIITSSLYNSKILKFQFKG
eukprot:GHVP01013788.1.p1 GENE.GHVP01013788.1~~GHVP01013788.1.p1  ORF type:complete len:351 (+),score=55.50 GHVP01013788.1:230-1282(+)